MDASSQLVAREHRTGRGSRQRGSTDDAARIGDDAVGRQRSPCALQSPSLGDLACLHRGGDHGAALLRGLRRRSRGRRSTRRCTGGRGFRARLRRPLQEAALGSGPDPPREARSASARGSLPRKRSSSTHSSAAQHRFGSGSVKAQPSSATDLGETLIAAIPGRDLGLLAASLEPAVRMRALIPPCPVQVCGREAAVARFASWFGGSEGLELLQFGSRPGRRSTACLPPTPPGDRLRAAAAGSGSRGISAATGTLVKSSALPIARVN